MRRHCEGAKRRSNPGEAAAAFVWIASLPLAMTVRVPKVRAFVLLDPTPDVDMVEHPPSFRMAERVSSRQKKCLHANNGAESNGAETSAWILRQVCLRSAGIVIARERSGEATAAFVWIASLPLAMT
jgi:hypothetical protein